MRIKGEKIFTLFCLAGAFCLNACSDQEPDYPNGQLPEEPVQTFTVAVESRGEKSPSGEVTDPLTKGGRPLFSMTPKQTIDRVDVLLLHMGEEATVVYRKTIKQWSDTDNIASTSYSDGTVRGREAVITLRGDELLEEGESYLAYGVGYHTGTYNGYEPFKGISTGDRLRSTEVVTLGKDEYVEEIFAGAQTFVVESGKIVAHSLSPEEGDKAIVRLRRQVGGTFGYFTRIPVSATLNGTSYPARSLRLVTPFENQSILFGGFRSQEDPNNFNAEKVVNGMTPRTDHDACLYGATEKNAFIVYEITLADWFPGGEDGMPLDINGDGYLDAEDTNWVLDAGTEEQGAIRLAPGSVFGNDYLIPVAMSQANIAAGIPTFQLQLLGENERILKHWNVVIRQEEELARTRTLVTLDQQGLSVVTTETNPETPLSYSIARNNLFTIGTRNGDQAYGEDTPIDLSTDEILVMDVNPEWEALGAIIFH